MPSKTFINLFTRPTFWYYVIMCFFGVMYYITVLGNHYYFRTPTFDYGTYNFAFWQYSHFHITSCPLYNSVFPSKGMGFFQDHFSFTLFFFIPIYWLLNWLTGTYTLLLIEITMILIGGWAVYKLVVFKSSDTWLGVLSLLYYFLMQGHYSLFNSDCNILVIASCFIPLFLYFFETGRSISAAIILIMILLSREDMPLWLIFIFLVLIIWHRKERKKVFISIYGIALCVVYFILVFTVFIPHTQDHALPYRLFQYSALGNTPGAAFIHILKHPFDTFMLLFKNQSGEACFNGVKKEFYLVYLISGGFILLYRPYYLLWFIPVIAQKMLNDDVIRWSMEGYYAVEVATLLPLAVFLILKEIKTRAVIKHVGGIILCILAAGVTFYMETHTPHAIRWINTTKENIFNKKYFNPNYNSALIYKELKLIPPNAPVSASEHITPHLAQRSDIYGFPDVEDAQYIAAFTFHDYYMISDSAYKTELDSYIINPHWSIIARTPEFVLLKKKSGR